MHRKQGKTKAFLPSPPEIRVAKRAGSMQEMDGVGRRTDWMHGDIPPIGKEMQGEALISEGCSGEGRVRSCTLRPESEG